MSGLSRQFHKFSEILAISSGDCRPTVCSDYLQQPARSRKSGFVARCGQLPAIYHCLLTSWRSLGRPWRAARCRLLDRQSSFWAANGSQPRPLKAAVRGLEAIPWPILPLAVSSRSLWAPVAELLFMHQPCPFRLVSTIAEDKAQNV